jgi:hypothetical protein
MPQIGVDAARAYRGGKTRPSRPYNNLALDPGDRLARATATYVPNQPLGRRIPGGPGLGTTISARVDRLLGTTDKMPHGQKITAVAATYAG